MKPLASIDVETTGTNTATDAIVSLGIATLDGQRTYYRQFKPWKPIPKEVEEIIGLTNADVTNEEPFQNHARAIHDDWLTQYDLVGFNLNGFDIPIIYEELYRCGVTWDLSGILVIDVGTAWKKLEERTLEAAVKKFLGRDHAGAHNALTDALATAEVLHAMKNVFPQVGKMTDLELADFSKFDDRKNQLTLDGKIIKGPDGDPIYNFGQKTKGVKVKDDLGFAYWILGKDFPSNTKSWLQNYMDALENEERMSAGATDGGDFRLT